jgi:hypothetical protein
MFSACNCHVLELDRRDKFKYAIRVGQMFVYFGSAPVPATFFDSPQGFSNSMFLCWYIETSV